MAIRKELIDELIASSGGSLIGPDGLVKELTKALVERMLTGESNCNRSVKLLRLMHP